MQHCLPSSQAHSLPVFLCPWNVTRPATVCITLASVSQDNYCLSLPRLAQSKWHRFLRDRFAISK